MNELRQFLHKHNLSQASIARSLGVSPTAISQYLNGLYGEKGGDVSSLETKINTYLANYLQQKTTSASFELVETDDLKMVDFICSETASGKEMGTVYGKAGTGKTVAVKAFAAKHPEAIVIESIPMTTPKGLLINILQHLGQREAQGPFEALHKQAVDIFKRSDRILVIDEAENLTTKSLETIRRLHDFSGVPVILVGTHALLQNLKGRHGELLQLYSRICNKHEMIGLTAADRKALFGGFGNEIKRFTDDIRRSVSMFRKALRFAANDGVDVSAQHIAMASNTVILD